MDLRIFTEPQQGASYDDQLAIAKVTEDEGFDAFFRSDHYISFGGGSGLPGPTDAWITLAGLARETSRIRLGTLVSPVTFRLPGPLAISVAEVDVMSGGRVELGLGTGWNPNEHSAYGIDFPPFGVRFEHLEEQLSIITGLWSTPVGEKFSFSGSHYTLTDSPALPKPTQTPHPPIVMGGAGKTKTPRLAAKFAAEYNTPFHTVDAASGQFDRVRAACEAAGRDPSSMVLSSAVTICCGADEAEVNRRAEAIGRPPANIDVAGTPQQCVDKLAEFAKVGAQRAYLQVLDIKDLDHVRLIAAEVLPAAASL